MRLTPLLDFQNAIIAVWTALAPPSYSWGTDPRNYQHTDKPSEGASAHRQFFFRVSSGEGITEQGKARHMITHRFEAVIQLHMPERTSQEREIVYREYQTLASALHTMAYPAGCFAPQVIKYFPEQPITDDAGDLDLVLVIEVRTREANKDS